MALNRIAKLIIVSIVALNLAGQFIAPACATQVPKTQAECEQAGMRWKDKAGKCKLAAPKTQAECEQAGMDWKPEADKCKPIYPLSPFQKIIALIGLGCALVGLFLVGSNYRNVSRKRRFTQ